MSIARRGVTVTCRHDYLLPGMKFTVQARLNSVLILFESFPQCLEYPHIAITNNSEIEPMLSGISVSASLRWSPESLGRHIAGLAQVNTTISIADESRYVLLSVRKLWIKI